MLQTSSRHKLGFILKLQYVHSYRCSVVIICKSKARMVSGMLLIDLGNMCVNPIITELTSVATKKTVLCVCVCVCVSECICICESVCV